MKACWVLLLTCNQTWLRASSLNRHKHPSGQENPECGDTGWKVQGKMWCELPQAWTQSFNKGKKCQVSLGNGLGRVEKKRLFAHSTEWQSGWDICCKRCANGPHLGIWVRHLDLGVSSCYKTLLRTLESQMREKLGHSHISAPAQQYGFSQAAFWAAHDKILDTWFLFSQYYQSMEVSLFQDSCGTGLLSTHFHKKTLRHCTDVKYCMPVVWHIHVQP